ncbi:MAG: hypothetical protein FWH20_00860 [Oscillospiraceae bacterium]|nr:hypothetical protein [Oscillospiraceae bacterium]
MQKDLTTALQKPSYDYTQWRQEYFENNYKSENKSRLECFLNAAANNDPKGISFGL